MGKAHGRRPTTINGRREELEGKIQQRYGVAKDEARKEIDDWLRRKAFNPGPPLDGHDAGVTPFPLMTHTGHSTN